MQASPGPQIRLEGCAVHPQKPASAISRVPTRLNALSVETPEQYDAQYTSQGKEPILDNPRTEIMSLEQRKSGTEELFDKNLVCRLQKNRC